MFINLMTMDFYVVAGPLLGWQIFSLQIVMDVSLFVTQVIHSYTLRLKAVSLVQEIKQLMIST